MAHEVDQTREIRNVAAHARAHSARRSSVLFRAVATTILASAGGTSIPSGAVEYPLDHSTSWQRPAEILLPPDLSAGSFARGSLALPLLPNTEPDGAGPTNGTSGRAFFASRFETSFEDGAAGLALASGTQAFPARAAFVPVPDFPAMPEGGAERGAALAPPADGTGAQIAGAGAAQAGLIPEMSAARPGPRPDRPGRRDPLAASTAPRRSAEPWSQAPLALGAPIRARIAPLPVGLEGDGSSLARASAAQRPGEGEQPDGKEDILRIATGARLAQVYPRNRRLPEASGAGSGAAEPKPIIATAEETALVAPSATPEAGTPADRAERIAALSRRHSGAFQPQITRSLSDMKPALGANRAAPSNAKLAPAPAVDRLVARINGSAAGSVELIDTDGTIKVKLGSILDLVSSALPREKYDRLSASEATETFVSLEVLKARGLAISYDPVYDELNLGNGSSPHGDPLKSHIDQIAPLGSGPSRTMMEQIP